MAVFAGLISTSVASEPLLGAIVDTACEADLIEREFSKTDAL